MSKISVPGNCTLQAQNRRQATLSGGNLLILWLDGNNITIDGLVVDGGTISFAGTGTTQYTGFVFTNNIISNYTAPCPEYCPSALAATAIRHSFIDSNVFSNLWPNGWPSQPEVRQCGSQQSVDCWGPTAMHFYSIDGTTISNNIFDKIASDSIAIDFETTLSTHFPGGPYTTTSNNIAYNTFTHQRRIPIEIQTRSAGACPEGPCNTSIPATDGLQVKGNFVHSWTFPFYDSWLSIVPDGSRNGYYINNTWIANVDPEGHVGTFQAPCQETSGDDVTVQATVCGARTDLASSWSTGFAIGRGSSQSTVTIQNIVQCGKIQNSTTFETADSFRPTARYRYNYISAAVCPGGDANVDQSSIQIAFTSPGNQQFPLGADAAWRVSVISNLSIKWVDFLIDGAASPLKRQELSDVNGNFASDRSWLYHATINTSAFGSGTHTITAKAIDVAGSVQAATQTFQVFD
ncbi:MAG: hypothetical protein JO061_23275 [Acidobacteriaceae bacterium]|nr:hypothetical protein [Acidobacteriaceae bacterium]